MSLGKAAKIECKIKVLFCQARFGDPVHAAMLPGKQPWSRATARGRPGSQPLGLSFSSANFFCKLNCNCNACLHSFLFIGSTIRLLQLGSRQEICLLAVAWMLILIPVRPLQEELGNHTHMNTLRREKRALIATCPCACMHCKRRFLRRAGKQCLHSRSDKNISYPRTRKRLHSLLKLLKPLEIAGWSKVIFESCNFLCLFR